MKRASRARLIPVASALLLCAGGVATWRISSARARDTASLPAFTEAPAGPRAPATSAFGTRVGYSALAAVESSAKERGLSCADTSARMLMKRAREAKAAEAAAKGVDVTTSASAKKKNAREMNPQVRLSCEGTRSNAIGDREREDGVGRVLYVFDSAELPLRHASYRRMHPDHARGVLDAQEALAALTAVYGAPPVVTGALPEVKEGETLALEKYQRFQAEWSYSDLKVTLSTLSFGERGLDVYEAVEVPWPVRADAPARVDLAKR